ncbi:hypothetical protein HmCmsJML028_03208 [Escherichia coli]|nr:hypothetical protein HmCmsJML028_03208 [Escherichia coli]
MGGGAGTSGRVGAWVKPPVRAPAEGRGNPGKSRVGGLPFPLHGWGGVVVPPGLGLCRMGRKEGGLRGES